MNTDFGKYFPRLASLPAGASAHAWQADLAASTEVRNQLVRIPTGFGKTFGVLGAWLWNRVERADPNWPCRLVWCLPMRVLVEQVAQEVAQALQRVDRLGGVGEAGRVSVQVLMGGADAARWQMHPQQPAVLIGTQDMLLSRALNRGYASPRARWPAEFGLLNHDALWVLDEVQLMDVGLATTGQLQAFREQSASGGQGLRPCKSWWMSATLQPQWLAASPETRDHLADLPRLAIAPDARTGPLWDDVTKPCSLLTLAQQRSPADKAGVVAPAVSAAHREAGRGAAGPTLVVVNRVDDAIAIATALRADAALQGTDVRLVHSRFRPHERAVWREQFLSRARSTAGTDRIIVATQVIEAGVDISGGVLVTELAPWPSLVQRFGRCARWGGRAKVVVVDFQVADDKAAAPYPRASLDAARAALQTMANTAALDVSPLGLERFEEQNPQLLAALYPYDPLHLLLRHEVDELFDTAADLSGADIDISRFIRSGDERDLLVFWHDLAPAEQPASELRAHRDGLCAVPFLKARDWLCGKETAASKAPRLKPGVHAWVWDWVGGQWRRAERRDLYPGQTVLVAAQCGGYSSERGWDAQVSALAPDLPLIFGGTIDPAELADAAQDDESLSATPAWQTIAFHGREVGKQAQALAQALASGLAPLLDLAGRWHDAGKAHPAFQNCIRPPKPDAALAKAPQAAWRRGRALYPMDDGSGRRAGFRHELASTLALFAVLQRHAPDHLALLGPWRILLDQLGPRPVPSTSQAPPNAVEQEVLALDADAFDLLAYLVCAHHGKVRVTWHASPADQAAYDPVLRIRGLRQGDILPGVDLAAHDGVMHPLPPMTVNLAAAAAGLNPHTGRGWTERVLALLERHGPFALAWLEALMIAADQRASADTTLVDPALKEENPPHGLETNRRAMASPATERADAHPSVENSTESGAQHGLRGRAGGPEDAGSRARTPHQATRYLNTTLGVLSYTDLAQHLSRRVQDVEFGIAQGALAERALDEGLILDLHRRICGELVPAIAGRWRRIDVQVSDHEAPSFVKLPQLMRDYALDLQARIAGLGDALGDRVLEFLAFAEGRLLSIHPFEDFNGRTTRVLLAELLRRLRMPDIDPTPGEGAETATYLQALKGADRADWQPLIAVWRLRFEKEGQP